MKIIQRESTFERLLAIAAPSPDGKDAGLEDAVRLSLGYTFLSKEVVVQLSSRVSCERSTLDNSKTGQERFRALNHNMVVPVSVKKVEVSAKFSDSSN